VPAGLTQGALHVTVKLAVPLIAFTGVLNAAVMLVVLTGTPVALLSGATPVTVGATPTGATVPPPLPRIGLWPPPPLQPAMMMATMLPNTIAGMRGKSREMGREIFIFVSGYLILDFVGVLGRMSAARDATTFHFEAGVEQTG
jgi:hypothetical protein